MRQPSKKNYIGEVLNGWEFLEEIPVDYPDYMSHQSRHQARRFKARHLETGCILNRTIGQIRNSRLKMPWERKDYVNLTGTQCGIYNVLELAEVSKVPSARLRSKIMWKAENMETGEVEELSTTFLMKCTRQKVRAKKAKKVHDERRKKLKHGARIREGGDNQVGHLYRTWQAIKQRCYQRKHTSFHHYGGKGMRLHTPWIDCFEAFRDGVVTEIGYCPDTEKTTLFVKKGLVFGPGNIEWVPITNKRSALTSESMYGKRLLLDTEDTRQRVAIEV